MSCGAPQVPERVQQVVEAIPRRFVKKDSGESGGEQKTA